MPVDGVGVARLSPGTLGGGSGRNAEPAHGGGVSGGHHERINERAGPLPTLSRIGHSKLTATIELTKPNITKLVTLTSAVGYVLGIYGQTFAWWQLAISALGCIIGTALSAAGANALNMWWERHRDCLMARTAKRPLPTGRMFPATAFLIGTGLSVAGVLTLALACNLAAASVSLATILIYVLVYTPMKVRSPLATLVGAVPGALPPLIGWCAALTVGTPIGSTVASGLWTGLTTLGGWSLFTLMFVWQIPHFLAIAWMYKDEYARGGHAVLPVFDPTGVKTTAVIVIGAVVLLPATLLPALIMPDRLGIAFAAIAGLTGIAYIVWCCRLLGNKSAATARAVFFGSIIHLPILLIAMVGEVAVRVIMR